MASVLFVSRMAEAQLNAAKFSFGADQIDNLTQEEEQIMTKHHGRIVLFHIEGPLSFGSARDIAKLIQSDIDKDVLVIDMSFIPFIDSSAAASLEEVIHRLNEIGDTVLLFGARDSVKQILRKTGVLGILGEHHLLETRLDALKMASSIIPDK